jgi:hypothetical protein
VKIELLDAELRAKIYFAVALVPSLYWGFWCLAGILIFSPSIAGNAPGILLLTACTVGLAGLIYALRSLLVSRKGGARTLLTNVAVYLGMALLLGYVLSESFAPKEYGIYLGWILVGVALVAALDTTIQHIGERSSQQPF